MFLNRYTLSVYGFLAVSASLTTACTWLANEKPQTAMTTESTASIPQKPTDTEDFKTVDDLRVSISAAALGGTVNLSAEDGVNRAWEVLHGIAVYQQDLDMTKIGAGIQRTSSVEDLCKKYAGGQMTEKQAKTLKMVLQAGAAKFGISSPSCINISSWLDDLTNLTFINFEPARDILLSFVNIKKVTLVDFVDLAQGKGKGADIIKPQFPGFDSPIVKKYVAPFVKNIMEKFVAEHKLEDFIKRAERPVMVAAAIVYVVSNSRVDVNLNPKTNISLGLCRGSSIMSGSFNCVEGKINATF